MPSPSRDAAPAAERTLICLIGPPADPARDAEAVRRLLAFPGAKAVCGGTTAALVARALGESIRVRFETATEALPPAGDLPGVDLVCEGIITLSRVLELLAAEDDVMTMDSNAAAPESGAATLYRLLCRAEGITILFGRAENPIRQTPRAGSMSKRDLIAALERRLKARGKKVEIETF
jgi:hypothetical protein